MTNSHFYFTPEIKNEFNFVPTGQDEAGQTVAGVASLGGAVLVLTGLALALDAFMRGSQNARQS